MEVRAARKGLGVEASMKRVDTCAAEFEAGTPYMYSSYDGNCECEPTTARKVRRPAAPPPSHVVPRSRRDRAVAMSGNAGALCHAEHPSAADAVLQVLILGAGPNRIGQGIEFDYCCCHASFALR